MSFSHANVDNLLYLGTVILFLCGSVSLYMDPKKYHYRLHVLKNIKQRFS